MFATAPGRPDDPRDLVGERNCGDVVATSLFEFESPGRESVRVLLSLSSLDDHRGGRGGGREEEAVAVAGR